MAAVSLTVNGSAATVNVDDPDTPLLYVLIDDLQLMDLSSVAAFRSAGPAPCSWMASQSAPARRRFRMLRDMR